MQRDWDAIKQLVFHVERADVNIVVEIQRPITSASLPSLKALGVDAELSTDEETKEWVAAELLEDMGAVETGTRYSPDIITIIRLTSDGHDLADTLRTVSVEDKGVWGKFKAKMAEFGVRDIPTVINIAQEIHGRMT